MEIRDPIYGFIHLDKYEKKFINLPVFQRLRYIHQLSLTYLIYPGATHTRFEHSLGVMHIATLIYDTLRKKNDFSIFNKSEDELNYYRTVLRHAALCHDIGHLPFSHTGEELLPPKKSKHEYLTIDFINISEIIKLFNSKKPPIDKEDVIKVAVGPKYYKNTNFSDFEIILSDIITSDIFGADRIDYLLRDSYYCGVEYGKFDYLRLLETITIVPEHPCNDMPQQPMLGIEDGGIHTIEGLILAHYFMYTQVYYHKIRRVYDLHLQQFIKCYLEIHYNTSVYNTDANLLINTTDITILSWIEEALRNPNWDCFEYACVIKDRKHHKLLCKPTLEDIRKNDDILKELKSIIIENTGCSDSDVFIDCCMKKYDRYDFPVLYKNGEVLSAQYVTELFNSLPTIVSYCLFVNREKQNDAKEIIEKKGIACL